MVGRINVDKLDADRDQLWAEAVARLQSGERWWITNRTALAEAERHQRDRYVGDPWEGVVSSFVDHRSEVTVAEILQDALSMDKGRWGQAEQNRIARCLISFGWTRQQVRTGDKREWRYRRPVTNGGGEAPQGEHMSNVTTLKPVTAFNR